MIDGLYRQSKNGGVTTLCQWRKPGIKYSVIIFTTGYGGKDIMNNIVIVTL
ncbi:hypothetical protein FLA_2062 [Filimonas lacunae]|nr:hypothetical protein FLA_2062 [Filimonas lacunae]